MNNTQRSNRLLHLGALVGGVLALVVLFAIPSGVLGYLIAIGAGLIAVLIGHRCVRRRGALLWAAVLGLVLAYLELLVSIGLLVVRLTRIFTS